MNKNRFSQIRFLHGELKDGALISQINEGTINRIGEDTLKEYVFHYLEKKHISQADLLNLSEKIYFYTGEELNFHTSIVSALYNFLIENIILPDYTNNSSEDFKEIDEILARIENKIDILLQDQTESGFLSLKFLHAENIFSEISKYGNIDDQLYPLPGFFSSLLVESGVFDELSTHFDVRIQQKAKKGESSYSIRPSLNQASIEEALKIICDEIGNNEKGGLRLFSFRETLNNEEVFMEVMKKDGINISPKFKGEKFYNFRIFCPDRDICDVYSAEELHRLGSAIFDATEQIINMLASYSDEKYSSKVYNISSASSLLRIHDNTKESGGSDTPQFEHHEFEKLKVQLSEKIKLSDIGGQSKAKEEIEKIIKSIQFEEIMKSWGAKPTSGIVFEGPSGTGKTLLAKAVASEIDADVYNVKLTDIASSAYINEGANNVKNLFAFIREKSKKGKRIVVILDELDALFMRRGSDGNSGEDTKIVNAFLTEMSGLEKLENVIFIGTTNLIEDIDPAVIRSGRLTTRVKVGYPDEEGIRQIYNIHLKKIGQKSEKFKNAISQIDLDVISEKSKGLTGADIEEIVRILAEQKALEEIEENKITPITTGDFEEAIKKLSIKNNRLTRIGFTAEIFQ